MVVDVIALRHHLDTPRLLCCEVAPVISVYPVPLQSHVLVQVSDADTVSGGICILSRQ